MVKRKCLPQLPDGPLGSRMSGHVEMDDAAALVGQTKNTTVWVVQSFLGRPNPQ